MVRQCFDCGATPAEAAFGSPRKPAGRVDRCIECASGVEAQRAERIAERRAELAAGRTLASKRMRTRVVLGPPQLERARRLRSPKAIITRASYRAALRRRAAQAQLDLVDLLVAAP